MPTYECPKCNKLFNHKSHYSYHISKRKRECVPHKIPHTPPIPHNVSDKEISICRCSSCGKTFSRKDNLKRHVQKFCKVNICEDNEVVKSRARSSDNIINSRYKIKHNYDVENGFRSNPSKLPPKTSKIQFSPPVDVNVTEAHCPYCKKEFTRHDNLTRHIEQRCTVRKRTDKHKEELYQLLVKQMKEIKDEISVLKKKDRSLYINKQQNIQNIQNNINNLQNYINNDIKLVAFGKEDLNEISDEVYKKILNCGFDSVPKLIEYIHFNKNKPEYHNVYIPNMQNNYAMVYNGTRWKLEPRDEIINRLLIEKRDHLVNKFDNLHGELVGYTIKKFNRFVEEIDSDTVINRIRRDIKLVLYNNKKIPLETKRLMESSETPHMLTDE